MATNEMHANRNLRPRVLSDGSRRGIDRYFSFGHRARPRWWDDGHPPIPGRAIGVYENCKESSRDALVITEEGLTVLCEPEPRSFRFADVARLVLPVKDPVSLSLDVWLRSGARFEIPLYDPVGVAFDFFRFLASAVREQQRLLST
ncbi:hypothetical protein [Sorangium sp. So ce176]|uniref:hypothetical protein n=1 Tax=Sorangium sp. So ce176 TaxID=3133286 RepID=UPI003F635DCF